MEIIIVEGVDEVIFLVQVIDEIEVVLFGVMFFYNFIGQIWILDSWGLVFLENLIILFGGLLVMVESFGKMKMVKLLFGFEGS